MNDVSQINEGCYIPKRLNPIPVLVITCIIVMSDVFSMVFSTIILLSKDHRQQLMNKCHASIMINCFFLVIQAGFALYGEFIDPTFGHLHLCRFSVLAGNYFVFVLTFLLSLSTLYRYLAFVYPITYEKVKRGFLWHQIIIFLISLLLSSPCAAIYSEYLDSCGNKVCDIPSKYSTIKKVIYTIETATTFIIPSAIMSYMYIKIVLNYESSNKNTIQKSNSICQTPNHTIKYENNGNDINYTKRKSKLKKLILRVLLNFLLFLISWGPYSITKILLVYRYNVNLVLFAFTNMLLLMFPTFYFILILYQNSKLYQLFIKLMCCKNK